MKKKKRGIKTPATNKIKYNSIYRALKHHTTLLPSARLGLFALRTVSDGLRLRQRQTHLESMPGSSLEHFPNTLTSLGTALDVALRSNLLGDGHTLGPGNRPLVHPGKILDSLAIVAEILLARHKDDWETLTEVKDLGNPLRTRVSVASRRRAATKGRTFSCTLSRESGESMAKQMRMTWESG